MITLALDTTALIASAAITKNGKLLCEYTVNSGNTHSVTLLPMITHMLETVKLTPSDIDLYAVSAGPGSFTGVRIGASILLGLAFERSIPCISVSSLQALSYNMRGISGDFIACPVMDARRGQLYNALFHHTSEGITRMCDDRIIMADQLAAELSQYILPVYLIGDGAYIAKSEYERGIIPPEQLRLQSAYSVAQTALKIYENASDKTVFEPQFFKPTYLRASQAERERLEREKTEKGE